MGNSKLPQDTHTRSPKNRIPYHPLLFALYPVLFLYARNLDEATFPDLLKPTVIVILLAGILFALARALFKDNTRAGILVSLSMVMIFTYGHVMEPLRGAVVVGYIAGKGRFTEFSDSGRVAHNSFVHCWAELGLFGYFFWLGLIIASLKDGWAIGKITSEEPDAQEMSRLAKAGIASMAGYLAASFFLSRTYVHPLYIFFGLFAAFRSIYERDVGPLASGFVKGDCKYVVAVEVLSIPALYVLIRILW